MIVIRSLGRSELSPRSPANARMQALFFLRGTRAAIAGGPERVALYRRTHDFWGCHQAYARGYVTGCGYARLLSPESPVSLAGRSRPRITYGCR